MNPTLKDFIFRSESEKGNPDSGVCESPLDSGVNQNQA